MEACAPEEKNGRVEAQVVDDAALSLSAGLSAGLLEEAGLLEDLLRWHGSLWLRREAVRFYFWCLRGDTLPREVLVFLRC